MELMPQLNVLQPRVPVRFSLDNRTPLDGLLRSDFRVDSRRKSHRGQEVFDHVVIHGLQKSGQKLTLSKDFPPEIERLEARLRQAGITADVETLRDADTGRLQEVLYRFVADLVVVIRATPDHDSGRLRFQLSNLDGFETVTAEFPAHRVTSALLDELARWLTGEPNQFLREAGTSSASSPDGPLKSRPSLRAGSIGAISPCRCSGKPTSPTSPRSSSS
jgi:hypothetical protein